MACVSLCPHDLPGTVTHRGPCHDRIPYLKHTGPDVAYSRRMMHDHPRECCCAYVTYVAVRPQAALLVARYAGKPELRARVEEAVRVQQNNDNAVRYGLAGALILEKVVLVSGWVGGVHKLGLSGR